jgi:hypothetical protein
MLGLSSMRRYYPLRLDSLDLDRGRLYRNLDALEPLAEVAGGRPKGSFVPKLEETAEKME